MNRSYLSSRTPRNYRISIFRMYRFWINLPYLRPLSFSLSFKYSTNRLLNSNIFRADKDFERNFFWTKEPQDRVYSRKSARSTRPLSRETLGSGNVATREKGGKAFLGSMSLLFFASVSRASSVPRLCRAKKERKERKEGRKKERGKSRRSSPSSKEAEEAFRAGLRIQSGRIIRSPAFIFISLSLYQPPPFSSSPLSRWSHRQDRKLRGMPLHECSCQLRNSPFQQESTKKKKTERTLAEK